MHDGIQDSLHNPVERSRRWRGFHTTQWVVLALLGGLLLAMGATLILVLRSGMADPTIPALSSKVSELESMPFPHTGEIVSPSLGVYWPPQPQPLALMDAPGSRLWWDTRYAYRREVFLDVIAQRAPAWTVAEILWDGEAAVREGKARADGADVRILFWDGRRWHEQTRTIRSGRAGEGWRISFVLAESTEEGGRYHLYYGYPAATATGPAFAGKVERVDHALLLTLGAQEAVEWGPTVTWTAHSTTTQKLVSPDGRMLFEHPAGGLNRDTRVRLRIVPISERSGFGLLPDYEFHADPPPGGAGSGQIVRWDPPVTVSINLAGLPDDASSLTWSHFRYELAAGTWEPVPIEFDTETGILRFTTDQP